MHIYLLNKQVGKKMNTYISHTSSTTGNIIHQGPLLMKSTKFYPLCSQPRLSVTETIWAPTPGDGLVELAFDYLSVCDALAKLLPSFLPALGVRFVLQSDSSPRLSFLPPHFFSQLFHPVKCLDI